jgi:hypothetical protein
LWFSGLTMPVSFEFLRSRRVSLMAGTGPGYGRIGMQPCAVGYGELTRRLGGACTQDLLVSRHFWTWAVEAGADVRLVVLRASSLSLSYRIAYLGQIGLGDWETVDAEPGKLPGGPQVDASGLRALVGPGFDLF